MRRVLYDELDTLARNRGESIAGLVDKLVVAELRRVGVTVPDYTPPARPTRPRARTPKAVEPAPDDGRYFGGYMEI